MGKIFLGLGLFLALGFVLLSALILQNPSVDTQKGGSPEIVQAALSLQDHINGAKSNTYDPADVFMQHVQDYWKTQCHDPEGNLCGLAVPGNLQCVLFVEAAYWLAGYPLPARADAQDFWPTYEHIAEWLRVSTPITTAQYPLPGDLMVWKGGGFLDQNGIWHEYGHIAIVISYHAPQNGQSGTLTVAQANAPGNTFADTQAHSNLYTMTVQANGTVETWPGYTVEGFLRNLQLTKSNPSSTSAAFQTMPAGISFETPYVRFASEAAQKAHIQPILFIRQIYQESGFQPQAQSPAGAVGIAQFLPGTAATLTNPLGSGALDPWNPEQALMAAALYMERKIQNYQGNYAKALAAYNAGDGGVQEAIQHAQQMTGDAKNWPAYLPAETQQYLRIILNLP